MKKKKLGILSLIIVIFSCGDIEESIDKSNQRTQEKLEKTNEERTNEERTIKEVTEYYAFVDKLRVREVPGLKSKRQGAKFVDVLDEGDKVTFLGEITDTLYKVKLRGRTMNAPFYKIKTQKGEIGWIFAGALSQFPVEVEHYRAAIFFDDTRNTSDWSYYASNAMNDLLGTGVESIYVTDDFDEVQIRSHRGDGKIIGTENISRLVKKHRIGVVCVEKGRSQKFVNYSPDMSWDIKEKFDMLGGHCSN